MDRQAEILNLSTKYSLLGKAIKYIVKLVAGAGATRRNHY
jgi:hypothetical protein